LLLPSRPPPFLPSQPEEEKGVLFSSTQEFSSLLQSRLEEGERDKAEAYTAAAAAEEDDDVEMEVEEVGKEEEEEEGGR